MSTRSMRWKQLTVLRTSASATLSSMALAGLGVAEVDGAVGAGTGTPTGADAAAAGGTAVTAARSAMSTMPTTVVAVAAGVAGTDVVVAGTMAGERAGVMAGAAGAAGAMAGVRAGVTAGVMAGVAEATAVVEVDTTTAGTSTRSRSVKARASLMPRLSRRSRTGHCVRTATATVGL